MIKIRADELSSKYNAIQFLSLLEKEGILETTWETHDGRMDKVWFYNTEDETKMIEEIKACPYLKR